jgi:hypothetical protein
VSIHLPRATRVLLGPLCLAAGISHLEAQAPPSVSPPPQHETRFFGVFSNDRTVPDKLLGVVPLSTAEKWKFGTAETFDPATLLALGAVAGFDQAEDFLPFWDQGARGFGRRYGAGFVDHATSDYLTGAVFPILTHEDPRYFRLGQGGFVRRFGYSLGRIAITRNDSGSNGANYSEFLGNAVAAGFSNVYLPMAEKTVGDTAEKFGSFLVSDALSNVLKEFWPDVRRKLFHRPEPVDTARIP